MRYNPIFQFSMNKQVKEKIKIPIEKENLNGMNNRCPNYTKIMHTRINILTNWKNRLKIYHHN